MPRIRVGGNKELIKNEVDEYTFNLDDDEHLADLLAALCRMREGLGSSQDQSQKKKSDFL